MRFITALWLALRSSVTSRADLIAENLALRHQLIVGSGGVSQLRTRHRARYGILAKAAEEEGLV